MIPPAAAVFATLTNTLNLWLAGRIVKVSGRLKRPWPDLSAMRFPPMRRCCSRPRRSAHSCPALIGIVAGVLAASLLMAYALLGFAVLHAITRGMDSRGFVLAGIYAAVARVLLADPDDDAARACRHRARYPRPRRAQKRGPPDAHSTPTI